MTTRREIRTDHVPQRDWQLADREDTAAKVGNLGQEVLRPGDALQEPRTSDNAVAALSGEHGALVPAKQDTAVVGQPGSVASDPCTFNQRAVVEGFEFKEAVTVAAAARVTFIRCTFRKLVTLANGAYSSFSQCHFADRAAVSNAGAALNVGIFGGVRSSGVAHVNVTVYSEMPA